MYKVQNKVNFLPDNFNEIISDKKICIIGCGGIGSILSEILIRGGFNNLVLVDFDLINKSNLGRQNFLEKDIGKSKCLKLTDYLYLINPNINIESFNTKLTKININEILEDSDLIVDCTDNFESRNLINEYCEKNNKTWIYNGAIKAEVSSCIFNGKDKLFDKVFKNIENEKTYDVGVLSSTTFLAGSLAYNNICKYFLNINENKLIKINLWNNKLFKVNLK